MSHLNVRRFCWRNCHYYCPIRLCSDAGINTTETMVVTAAGYEQVQTDAQPVLAPSPGRVVVEILSRRD